MKANNYNEIAIKIQNAQAKGHEVDKMWDSLNVDYDACMKAERALRREVKTIANSLGFSINWCGFKGPSSILRLLDDLERYVRWTVSAIERVRSEFEPHKSFWGGAYLKKDDK